MLIAGSPDAQSVTAQPIRRTKALPDRALGELSEIFEVIPSRGAFSTSRTRPRLQRDLSMVGSQRL